MICAVGLAIAVQQSPVAQPASGLDPRIQKLLESISGQRLAEIVKKLQSFETRHTLSSATSDTRGIGAARQWILDEMTRASPALKVSFDTYTLPKQGDRIPRDVELRNVMAILPGKSARRIYVSGHYDSLARRPKPAAATDNAALTKPAGSDGEAGRSSGQSQFDWADADNFAPGANDDGSGTALTMEAGARVRRRAASSSTRRSSSSRLPARSRGSSAPTRTRSKAQAEKARDRRGLQQRHRRQPGGRQRHRRRRDACGCFPRGPRIHRRASSRGSSSGRRRATCRRIACGSSRGTIGSAAAAITRAFNQRGYAGVRFTRVATRTTPGSTPLRTRPTASIAGVSRAERPRERRGPSPSWRLRRRRRCGHDRAAADARPASVRLRRAPALASRPRAPRAIVSSGATRGLPTGSTRSTVGNVTEFVLPDVLDRRLRVRSGRHRTGGPRERGHRLRQPAARAEQTVDR